MRALDLLLQKEALRPRGSQSQLVPLQVPATTAISVRRRLGAATLVAGGLLETTRLIVLSFISPVLPQVVGALIYAVPSICLGVGLIVLGSSSPRRGRIALAIAGGLSLLTVAVNFIQIALRSPLGPAPSLLASFLTFVSILAAAAVLLIDRSLSGPPRWAIGVPALAIAVLLITLYAPVPAAFDHANVLPPLGFAVAGALLLRYLTAPTPPNSR